MTASLSDAELRDLLLQRVERAQEQAAEVLLAVSTHAVKGLNLSDFYRRLARTVGELVGAGRVLFWRLDEDGLLSPVAGGYRADATFLRRLRPTPCTANGDDLASKVVYGDLVVRASAAGAPAEFASVLEDLGVSSLISVPWRAADQRLGLVSAYDSTRPDGFSQEDAWVLQNAGLAAGLVTRLWLANEDLRGSVERLAKVDAARQMVLRNMNAVVERERKRFVSELHDDALQKLTAAELHLARVSAGENADIDALESVRSLLQQTETALRRLVLDIPPPSIESTGGLEQSIRDRLEVMASSGIKPELELDLPADLSLDTRTMVFREVAEALGNVERHSKATTVVVTLTVVDGGVQGAIRDDGQGFDVAERTRLPGHLGLLALRERALMAGGRYRIDSRPGAGTNIEFWIPLAQ